MEKSSGDQTRKGEREEENKGGKLEGLPVDSSPYTQYKDLEDYKSQGYGTQGHLQPKPGRGGGATDAPTPSGDQAAAAPGARLSPTDPINRRGVP